MDPDVQRLVDQLGLTALPVEGTWFVSTYRSAEDTGAGGPVGTAMIGMYSADPPSRSLFHRLTFDEVWHFYLGDPLRLVLLHPDGSGSEVVMGSDLGAGQVVQHVVPAGVWQAGELLAGGRFALFGCTMAPGFTSTCFEGWTVSQLLAQYPDRADDIQRLAIPDGHATEMPRDFAT
jgi:predicted cupin superfamily sugar epimerase